MFPKNTSRQFLTYSVEALLVFSLIAIFLAPSASADTVYTYTGNAFDSFHGNFACPPECKITGSFTLAQPLTPNLSLVTIFPKSFIFTDGAVILTPVSSFPFIFKPFMDFSTDSTGAIVAWDVRIQEVPLFGHRRLVSVNVPGASVVDETAVLFTVGASNTNDPGTWSVTSTNIPEPSCFVLLLIGLVGITGVKRIGPQLQC